MNEKHPLRLRKRAEFLAVRNGVKQRGPLFLLEVRKREKEEISKTNELCDMAPRIGFTVSKKNGNAVKRNRIRRRLREAVCEIAKDHLKRGTDYVIVARPDCLTVSYDRLKNELKHRFNKV